MGVGNRASASHFESLSNDDRKVILFFVLHRWSLDCRCFASSDADECWLSCQHKPTPIPTRTPSAASNPTATMLLPSVGHSHIIGVARLFVFLFSMVIARVLRISSPLQKNLPDQMTEQTLCKSPKLLFSDNLMSMLI